MAGYYCQVTGVTFAAGRLQVAYEHRNGDLNTFAVVDNGIIGYDVSSLAGSTPAQKLASLKSQLDATLTQRNAASTAASAALTAVQTALVGLNFPAAP